MSLHLHNLSKHYGSIHAVSNVSVELAEGETLALLGPSGCGKSTLLRLVAGLEQADEGQLRLNNTNITRTPPQKRGFGMVFQDYALFPHLNVYNNIAFGLVEAGWRKAARDKRVAELLELVGLQGYEKRRVQELSGGEQQRVALARALAPEPPLLLLDEPLSNLDQSLRESLKLFLRDILSAVNVRAIYVTHDQSEAFVIAQRIAVMRAGRLVQVAKNERLFNEPATPWVAKFLGHKNVFAAGNDALPVAGPVLLRTDFVRLLDERRTDVPTGQMVVALLEQHERSGGGLHALTLFIPEWQERLIWEGYSRDVPDVATGERVQLVIPDAAWQPLKEDA